MAQTGLEPVSAIQAAALGQPPCSVPGATPPRLQRDGEGGQADAAGGGANDSERRCEGGWVRPVSCSPAAPGSLRCCLLSGGDSRRMGRDKALLPHPEGGTWLERSLGLLAAGGGAQRRRDGGADRGSLAAGAREPRPARHGDALALPRRPRLASRGGLREHSLLRRLQSPAGDRRRPRLQRPGRPERRRPRQPPPRLAMRRWPTWAAEACADRAGAALR